MRLIKVLCEDVLKFCASLISVPIATKKKKVAAPKVAAPKKKKAAAPTGQCEARKWDQRHGDEGGQQQCANASKFMCGDKKIKLCKMHATKFNIESRPLQVRDKKRYGLYYGTIYDTQWTIMRDARFDFSDELDEFREALMSDERFKDHAPFYSDTGRVRIHWQTKDQYDFMDENNMKEDNKTSD